LTFEVAFGVVKSMQSVTLALPASFQLDQFRVESVLGKGGFGITYVATDLRLNKKVALKELLPDTIHNKKNN
jgi:serine/threonine protein kinase